MFLLHLLFMLFMLFLLFVLFGAPCRCSFGALPMGVFME